MIRSVFYSAGVTFAFVCFRGVNVLFRSLFMKQKLCNCLLCRWLLGLSDAINIRMLIIKFLLLASYSLTQVTVLAAPIPLNALFSRASQSSGTSGASSPSHSGTNKRPEKSNTRMAASDSSQSPSYGFSPRPKHWNQEELNYATKLVNAHQGSSANQPTHPEQGDSGLSRVEKSAGIHQGPPSDHSDVTSGYMGGSSDYGGSTSGHTSSASGHSTPSHQAKNS